MVENTQISIKNSKLEISNYINLIDDKVKFEYSEVKQTQEIKTNAPICNKCFRLVSIEFAYIQNYITTICPYCNNIKIYKNDNFYTKITKE